jgi:hypothetical protein
MFQWVYATTLAFGRVVGSWELTVHACSVPVCFTPRLLCPTDKLLVTQRDAIGGIAATGFPVAQATPYCQRIPSGG